MNGWVDVDVVKHRILIVVIIIIIRNLEMTANYPIKGQAQATRLSAETIIKCSQMRMLPGWCFLMKEGTLDQQVLRLYSDYLVTASTREKKDRGMFSEEGGVMYTQQEMEDIDIKGED